MLGMSAGSTMTAPCCFSISMASAMTFACAVVQAAARFLRAGHGARS